MTEKQIEDLRKRAFRHDYDCVERKLPPDDYYVLRRLYQIDLSESMTRRVVRELVAFLGLRPPEIRQRANTIMGEAWPPARFRPNGVLSLGRYTATAGVVVHELAHFVAGFDYNHKDAMYVMALRVTIGAARESKALAPYREMEEKEE